MKKIFLMAGLFLLTTHISFAQDAAVAKAEKTNPKTTGTTTATDRTTTNAPATKTVFITSTNRWQHIEMKTTGDQIYFTNLDGMGTLKVYVNNSDGAEKMRMDVSAEANAINCGKLKSGLYFLTLVNENTEEKKAFMLTRP